MNAGDAKTRTREPVAAVTPWRWWSNLIGYHVVWFCAVMGAAHGLTWPSVAAFVGFAAWQLGISRQRRLEAKLMALAVGCGLLLDGSLAASGWLDYATSAFAIPPGGAPLWILAMWASFALMLTQALQFLQQRLWLAGVLGAIVGPLTYWCAARAWHVVAFAPPDWRGLLGLAIGWGLAMPLLAATARRLQARRHSIDPHGDQT